MKKLKVLFFFIIIQISQFNFSMQEINSENSNQKIETINSKYLPFINSIIDNLINLKGFRIDQWHVIDGDRKSMLDKISWFLPDTNPEFVKLFFNIIEKNDNFSKDEIKKLKHLSLSISLNNTALGITNKYQIAKFLIDNGAKIDTNIFCMATRWGHYEIIKYALENNYLDPEIIYIPSTDFLHEAPVELAIWCESDPKFKLLKLFFKKEYRPNVNYKPKLGDSLLIRAAKYSDREHTDKVFNFLLKQNANVFTKYKDKNVLDILLKKEKKLLEEISEDNDNELIAELKNIQSKKKFLKTRLDQINKIKNELFESIKNGNYENTKELITKMSLGIFDKDFNNPLHLAAIYNQAKIFGLILSIRKELLDQKNNYNKTPIELAMQKGKIRNNIIMLLNQETLGQIEPASKRIKLN